MATVTLALALTSAVLLITALFMAFTIRRPRASMSWGPFWKVPREAFESHGDYVRFMVGTSCAVTGSSLLVIALLTK